MSIYNLTELNPLIGKLNKVKIRLTFIFILVAQFAYSQNWSFRFPVDSIDASKIELDEESLTPVKKSLLEVQNNLYQSGYLAASIDSFKIDSLSSKIWVYLQKGETYKWTSLKPGNTDEGILSKLGYRTKVYRNKPVNSKQVANLLDELITYYENNGFPFASARLDSLKIEENNIEASLSVEKGTKVTIDSIKFISEDKLPENYLANYINITKGSLYSEKKIGQIETRFQELSFANLSRRPEVLFGKKNTILVLTVKKEKANNIDGVLGFQPQENEDPVFTGDVQLNFKNALGIAEKIALQWKRLQDQTQRIDLEVEIPYIFKTRFGVSGELGIYRLDTSFTNIEQQLGIHYYLRGDDKITAFINQSSTNLISTEQFEQNTTLPENADVSYLSYGLGATISKLDYRLNPSKGYELKIKGLVGNKEIERNPALENVDYDSIELSTTQYKTQLNLNHYIPLAERLVLNNNVQGGLLYNESLFKNELFRIGGLRTLRGFDEESIFASSYAIHKSEIRYILERNSFVYGFFNWAWYERDISNEFVTDVPYGFGAGVSFETRAGIFTINYALGKQFNNPVTFRSGKVHFGFANFF